MHHKISLGGLHRCKREGYITKKRRITTRTSMLYPDSNPDPTAPQVTIGLVQNHDTAALIMTDPLLCLTASRRQSRPYASEDVLQTCTCFVVKKSVKDDSSD
ncbi:hypothetical protein TNCV_3360061 [Trichonephila clavipes]|nr:hypothetical protein TNCV_3360061 [Trichonephila clavipes]